MAGDTDECFDPVEDCPWRSPHAIFADLGYAPIPPAELTDRQVPGRLWELLYAAAGRRFFFSHTDHLSDRELYALLWEQWLDEPTADIPLAAETNTRLIVAELNAQGMTHEEIWLRFYADAADRELWCSPELAVALPPHTDPPYDRDRFLPLPPIPPQAQAGWLPEDEASPQAEPADSLDLTSIENELAAAPGEADSDAAGFDPPESALEDQLQAMEPENWVPPAQTLAAEHIPLLPPAEVTDETLTPVLWELLHNLALQGFYLLHTDHISDRELYAELWQHGLREPAHLPGRTQCGGWFHDLLGSWGEEDQQLWLKYYATDQERARHASEWPKDTIPAKAQPLYHRDWRLPKGPF